MILRTYEPSDREAVWALHNLALDGAGANDPGPWYDNLDRVETCYFDGGDFLVGYHGERLVAMAGCGGSTKQLAKSGACAFIRIISDRASVKPSSRR